MRTRKGHLLAATAFAATLLGTASAFAGPIALLTGPIYGKFTGVEQVAPGNNTMGVGSPYPATSGTTGADCTGCINENSTGNTEGTFGVFVVNGLYPGAVNIPNQQIAQNGSAFFSDGQNGGNQITGFFYGTTITSFSTTGATGNGGIVDLYWWDKNDQTQASADAGNPAALRTSQTEYTGYTCANAPAGTSGCTFLARLDLVPGAVNSGAAVDPTATAQADGDLTTTNQTGTSNFYLEVDTSDPGAWTNALASQFFLYNSSGFSLPDIADLRAQYDFLHCTTGCPAWNGDGQFGENLQDPFTANVVPEPASLALLGTALLGVGFGWRQRNRR